VLHRLRAQGDTNVLATMALSRLLQRYVHSGAQWLPWYSFSPEKGGPTVPLPLFLALTQPASRPRVSLPLPLAQGGARNSQEAAEDFILVQDSQHKEQDPLGMAMAPSPSSNTPTPPSPVAPPSCPHREPVRLLLPGEPGSRARVQHHQRQARMGPSRRPL